MLIGFVRERKMDECRVALTPAAVRELVVHGHQVIAEREAGDCIGFGDGEYVQAGARLASNAAEVFRAAELIVKVEEPLPDECEWLEPGQILFAQLRLASDPETAEALASSGAACIACETITDAQGGYPVVRPMSEIAGRLAVQEAGHYLTRTYGRGILIGGVRGGTPARVLVIGAGIAGSSAAHMAAASGANVVVIDRLPQALRRIEASLGARVQALAADRAVIEQQVPSADVVIAAAREPGRAAPRLVSAELASRMQRGSLVVDLSIDEGGCFETSHPTTHADPVYLVNFVVHHCVPNLPAAVPRTASEAMSHSAMKFILALADRGWRRAVREDPGLRDGLNVALGRITHPGVAAALGRAFTAPETLLE